VSLCKVAQMILILLVMGCICYQVSTEQQSAASCVSHLELSDAQMQQNTAGQAVIRENQAGHDVQDRGEATSKLMDEQSIFLLPAQPEGSQGIKRKRTH
jgi:hypothetical protein